MGDYMENWTANRKSAIEFEINRLERLIFESKLEIEKHKTELHLLILEEQNTKQLLNG